MPNAPPEPLSDAPSARFVKRPAARLRDRLPADCRVCRQWGAGGLCEGCVRQFCTQRPRCLQCGLGLPPSAGDGAVCGSCLREPPPWQRALCAEDYAFPWSGLIAEYKFRGDVALAGLLADRMSTALRQRPGALNVDLLLPVPLSTQRLQERGFNQAWELTRRVASCFKLTAEAHVLQRPIDTAHQVDLSLQDRARNLRGAFMVAPDCRQAVDGRRVALVDDVMTTGATFREATRALLEAGASAVHVWALARTP